MPISLALGLHLGAGGVSGPPFTIALDSFDDDSDTLTLTTERPNTGVWHIARGADSTTFPTYDGSAWTDAAATDTASVGASGAEVEFGLGGTTGTEYAVSVYQLDGTDLSNRVTFTYTADVTAPTLSSFAARETDTRLTVRAISDENAVDYFLVVTTDAGTPTAAQIIAGQDATGSAPSSGGATAATITDGFCTATIAGLTNTTAYNIHAVARDLHGNVSSVVSTTGTPTATPAAISRTAPALTDYTYFATDANATSYTTSTAFDFSAVTGTNDVVLVFVAVDSGAGSSTPITLSAQTAGGTDLEEVAVQRQSFSGRETVSVFLLKKADMPTGSEDITVSISGSTMIAGTIQIVPFGGVYQGKPIALVSGTDDRDIAAPEAGCFLVASSVKRSISAIAAPSGYTNLTNFADEDGAQPFPYLRHILAENTSASESDTTYSINDYDNPIALVMLRPA